MKTKILCGWLIGALALAGSAMGQESRDVTFSVDMSVQIGLGNFNPDTMGVEVRGGFNGWGGGSSLTRQGETGVYSGGFAVAGAEGAAMEYKFFGTPEPGGLTWESVADRSFNLGPAGTPQVLDTVYFNNEEPPSGLQLDGTWNPAATGVYAFTVTRSDPGIGDEIQLSVDNEMAASVPATVTFGEGLDEASFDVTILSLVDGDVTVTAEDPVSGDSAEFTIRMPGLQ